MRRGKRDIYSFNRAPSTNWKVATGFQPQHSYSIIKKDMKNLQRPEKCLILFMGNRNLAHSKYVHTFHESHRDSKIKVLVH